MDLACPRCDGEYLHHTEAVFFNRGEDADSVVKIILEGVEGIQRLLPTFDGSDDVFGIGGPREGPCFGLVVLGEEAVDGGLEVDDGVEDAAFQTSLRELCEEAFDRVEPGTRGRREVEGEALVAAEPGAHLGVLVGSIVVEDDVHGLAGGNLGADVRKRRAACR